MDITAGIVKNADIVIVGGGIAGIMLLYYLVNSGFTNTYLVNETTIGFHASGRNGGQCFLRTANLFSKLPNGVRQDYLEFVLDNNKKLLHGIRNMNVDTELKETGGLRLALNDKELEDLAAESKFLAPYVDCPVLDAKEIQSLLPTSKFIGGMFVPNEFVFNPYKVVNGLRDIIEQTGNRILTNTQVEKVVKNDDETLSITIRHRGTINTKNIVYCMGAYSNDLLSLDNIITPVRGQMLMTDYLADEIHTAIPVMSMSCNNGQEYFRLNNNRLIAGGMRTSIRGEQKGIIFDGEVSNTVYDKLRFFLTDNIPALAGMKCTHTWTGILDMTSDSFPLIGPISGNEYVMSGFNGYGYSHIILGSMIIRDLIRNKTTDNKMAPLFDPRRFNA